MDLDGDGAVAVEIQVLETDLYDSANVDMPKPGRRLQTAPRATRNLIVRYGGATALSNVTLARWAPQPHWRFGLRASTASPASR